MKRHLLILSLLLLTATSASAQTAYAIWCADAKTLYFDYTTSSITAGSTYQGQTVTNVWSGEAVTNSGFVYRAGRSEPTYCAWYDAAHAQAEKVVIKHDFYSAPVIRTDGWFMNFSKLTTVEGLSNMPRGTTRTAYMFNECSSLTSLDLSGFDTSKSTNMTMMFNNCKALTTINLAGFDTSSSQNMMSMFRNCSKLTSLDLSNFNTSNVTTMMQMFTACSKLTSLDFSSFDTSNVTSMRDMFSWCTSLTSLDLSSFNTSNVTTMMQMFDFCSSLVTLDLSNFDLSKVETMSGMFGACSQLQTIYCNATVASDVGNALFSGCTSLVGAVAFDSSKTGSMMANPAGYFTRKVNPNDANQNRIIGDVNGDKNVDISDIVAVINTIAGDPTYKETAKVNDDDKVDISDIVAIINIIASGSSQTETDPAVEAGLCPDTHHPHTIDLGDGGLWSCCNVGASAPWECGGYYAWGETDEKSAYDWKTYTHCDGSKETCRDLGSDIAGTQYDVAHVKWGDGWQMPSKEQLELLTKSSHRWTRINGVFGRKVIGANGASIFLPLAAPNEDGFYWSSTQDPDISSSAFGLEFDSYFVTMPTTKRYLGKSVRPVKQTDAAVKAGLCPDINHPHVIDLGIGVKFACCNVGTSAPWAIGYYYAWGETVEKRTYDWTTYTHCDGNAYSCRNIGNDISGTQYDVAYVKWGEGWGMPSSEQIKLVIQNCKNERISVNGVDGLKVTGPNNKSIFLPATGYCTENTTDGVGNGYYWTSTQDTDYSTYCYLFSFGSAGNLGVDEDRRSTGITVRPVKQVYTVYEVEGVKFKMVNVEGGVFKMGSEYGERDESPVHEVKLSSFSIGQTEVTQELWEAVMGSNPSKWKGLKLPVENVSWNDCQTFITKLNALTGKQFRLPTEAEWEYAARGGSQSKGYTYSGSNSFDDVAWYSSNSGSKTHEVATKSPNELGIYDMSGNVCEWCQDWFGRSYYASSVINNPTGPSSGYSRVRRGGSWISTAADCCCANRGYYTPSDTGNFLGFRLAL